MLMYFAGHQEIVFLTDLSPVHEQRSVENHLPATLTFNLQRGDKSHALRLVRNPNLNQNAPMYTIYRQRLVELKTGRLKVISLLRKCNYILRVCSCAKVHFCERNLTFDRETCQTSNFALEH